MTLIFNHIPKTGGTSLRVILNKVYQPEHVFFIKSKDIASSYKELEEFQGADRMRFEVISGHGADMFIPLIEDPFKITVLREPVALFLSQYHYLRNSPNSNFLKEVSSLENIEEYLDYAIQKGQDNLLTRYLSGSTEWLIQPELPVPELEKEGTKLLAKAKQNLATYNAVLDLKNFDAGVFALAHALCWKTIPIYRPRNQNKLTEQNMALSAEFDSKLRHLLRFDIELYDWFIKSKLDISEQVNRNNKNYRIFSLRQKTINWAGRFVKD